jgi:hypothetical protein
MGWHQIVIGTYGSGLGLEQEEGLAYVKGKGIEK